MLSDDSRHSDDDVVEPRSDRRSHRFESFQLTPTNDEEELGEDEQLSAPRLAQRQNVRRKLFLSVLLVLLVVLITVYGVTTTRNNSYSADYQPIDSSESDSSATTIASDTVSNEEIDPLPTAGSIECSLPSTRSSDSNFLAFEEWRSAGCHRMECVSESYLRNTRDRLSHSAPLCRGQALCNGDDEKFPGVLFQFGLTPSGVLVWQKCNPLDPTQTEIITLSAEAPTNSTNTSSMVPPQNQLWFQMTPDATWQILSTVDQNYDSSSSTIPEVVWEQSVENQPRPVGVTSKCLSNNPALDCPYIHFRRHGDIIMNYIDAQDGWVACKSRKICYSSLWE